MREKEKKMDLAQTDFCTSDKAPIETQMGSNGIYTSAFPKFTATEMREAEKSARATLDAIYNEERAHRPLATKRLLKCTLVACQQHTTKETNLT